MTASAVNKVPPQTVSTMSAVRDRPWFVQALERLQSWMESVQFDELLSHSGDVGGAAPILSGADTELEALVRLSASLLEGLRDSAIGLPPHRVERKQEQLTWLLASFLLLDLPLQRRLRVVDFCSGAGHFGFVVGRLFPHFSVWLVEINAVACRMALETKEKYGLTNVHVINASLTDLIPGGSGGTCPLPDFDVGLGLHACGDGPLSSSARAVLASYSDDDEATPVVSTEVLAYPRSSLLRQQLSAEAYFELAAAADMNEAPDRHGAADKATLSPAECHWPPPLASWLLRLNRAFRHRWDSVARPAALTQSKETSELGCCRGLCADGESDEETSLPLARRTCKLLVEMDRLMAAHEHGYTVRVIHMPLRASPKNDIIIGRPPSGHDRLAHRVSLTALVADQI